MAWIESHQKLIHDPKLLDLMEHIQIEDMNTVIGICHRFWWWCVDHAESGDLSAFNDNQLARAVGLNGEHRKLFVKAMVNAGFIEREPYFRVSNWWKFVGRFLQAKYKQTPEKWRLIKGRYDEDCVDSGHSPPKQPPIEPTKEPNKTEPNKTEPKEKELVQKLKPISDKPKRASTVPDDEWLNSLRENPAYKNLDIKNVFGKMIAWCELKRLKPTRRRLLNWLNREEAPLVGKTSKKISRIDEINNSLQEFMNG